MLVTIQILKILIVDFIVKWTNVERNKIVFGCIDPLVG